ncbi:DNA-directed RNA polymerase subunit beta [Nocardia cyriacigeorgica]|uniref:DNA-directed RNA polymerase subunit beta n=2 Tax=Nocardia cyriacigeorgica TaxID=135487 RepID=UPI002454EFFE|nr:DNA-directed RNA polymerase subunit beta [Nocardia cyriacigeorgica]
MGLLFWFRARSRSRPHEPPCTAPSRCPFLTTGTGRTKPTHLTKGAAMEHVPFGDTPFTRCVFYRKVCDLPATIDPPEIGRIVMPADHVWAVMMPAHLGQRVRIHLRNRGAETGPIISHLRSNRWSYLVRPDLPDETALFAELFRIDVSVVRTGGTIALPSPTDRGARFRRWIQPPRCAFRPSGQAIVASIRACAGAHAGWGGRRS